MDPSEIVIKVICEQDNTLVALCYGVLYTLIRGNPADIINDHFKVIKIAEDLGMVPGSEAEVTQRFARFRKYFMLASDKDPYLLIPKVNAALERGRARANCISAMNVLIERLSQK